MLGAKDFLSIYGSVVPRSLPFAIYGGAIGFLLKYASHRDATHFGWGRHYTEGGQWYHPYTLNVFAMVFSFSLVMRIQIAYARFWEGASQTHLACSKWGDAVMQVFAFDEASKDAFSEDALEFRMLILHYASLMTACALVDIRRDDLDLDAPLTLNRQDPFLFRAKVDEAEMAAMGLLSKEEEGIAMGLSLTSEQQAELGLGEGATAGGGSGNGAMAGGSSSPGAGEAHVPLQQLLVARRALQQRHQTPDINSFEPIDAKDKARAPTAFSSTTLDKQRPKDHGPQEGDRLLEGDGGNGSTHGSNHGAAPAGEGRRGSLQRIQEAAARRREEAGGVRRGGLCGSSGGAHIVGAEMSERSMTRDRSATRRADEKLARGEMSRREYLTSAVLLSGSRKSRIRLAKANCFDVLGGVSQTEIETLEPIAPGDRAFVVQTWMVRLMTNRLAAGGLAIPPPLLSRTYQVLSDGTAAMMQARKVSYVAFPFPLRQLLVLLLLVFIHIAPIGIASFMSSEPFVLVVSFFVCLGYTALNETAAELEHPFGLGANNLRLTAYQRQFNSKLARLFDQTIPNLGYTPTSQAIGATTTTAAASAKMRPRPAKAVSIATNEVERCSA